MENKNVFIIAPKESYRFIDENMDKIIKCYDLENSNIVMPYNFEHYDHINLMIDKNSQNFLIESDEYVKSLDSYHSLTPSQIQDLRILETKKRSYIDWLSKKSDYSFNKIKKTDACVFIFDAKINEITKNQLRKELNIAKELDKNFIFVDNCKIVEPMIAQFTKQKTL